MGEPFALKWNLVSLARLYWAVLYSDGRHKYSGSAVTRTGLRWQALSNSLSALCPKMGKLNRNSGSELGPFAETLFLIELNIATFFCLHTAHVGMDTKPSLGSLGQWRETTQRNLDPWNTVLINCHSNSNTWVPNLSLISYKLSL